MRLQHGPGRRAGYTFVELLFVIAIVAILASLLLAAVQRVLILQARTETASDITQMQQSLNAARAKYDNVEFLPSRLLLFNDISKYSDNLATVPVADRPLAQQTGNVLRYMFGRRFLSKDLSNNFAAVNWGAGGVNGIRLQGSECLVFYLGGMPDATGGLKCVGFSANPRNPTLSPVAPGGNERIGPFFQFKSARLVVGPSGDFLQYRDPHTTPFAYFGAMGPNNYDASETQTITNSKGVPMTLRAYFENGSNPTKWLNPNSFQIISAGRDLQFGIVLGPALPPNAALGWSAKNGWFNNGVGADDMSNFSQTELGNGIE